MDFLYSVVDDQLRQAESYDWSSVYFVFPNRRAGVFFSDTVSRWLKDNNREATVFGLNVTTMGDLLLGDSKDVVGDRMTLSCKLYEAYCECIDEEQRLGIATREKKDFGTFYTWCGSFLNDFDDIDRNLVDLEKLYEHVEDWQRLGDNLEGLSEHQRRTIEAFWGDVFTESEDKFGDKVKVIMRFVEAGARRKALYDKFCSILERDHQGDRKWQSGLAQRRAAICLRRLQLLVQG